MQHTRTTREGKRKLVTVAQMMVPGWEAVGVGAGGEHGGVEKGPKRWLAARTRRRDAKRRKKRELARSD